jgi:hypothetical protein
MCIKKNDLRSFYCTFKFYLFSNKKNDLLKFFSCMQQQLFELDRWKFLICL